MIEREIWNGFKGMAVFVEGENVDAVVEFFDKAADGEVAAAVGKRRGEGGKGEGVDGVGRVVCDGVFGSEMGFLA